jgi:hypothetical protein
LSGFKDKESLELLATRIVRLTRLSGFQGSFAYLKECLRLTTAALSGRPSSSSKIWVKIDRNGFPKILPTLIRSNLVKREDLKRRGRYVGAVLTALSVFRAFRTYVRPDLDTIVSPFRGTARTFDGSSLERACRELGRNLRVKPVEIIGGEKAGPNG